ncbi:MAG TPA: cysteine synthase family protein [Steroidobacteraceae bacterium]|nr:cysteine synthase family protein [Steroidobacteraceae bacterium]
MPVGREILGAIGNTPLVELRRVVPKGSSRVVVKLESSNPTGSMKDRVAKAMVEAAITDGRLPPGGTVVEYTGGSTGISLGLICAALGYKAHFVSSDAFSDEKLDTMRAYGAELTLIPSEERRITAQLIKAMMAKAEEISREPGHWFCNQINNADGEAGYHAMGDELWTQTAGRIDAFVQSVGSAHSIHGTAEALRRHNPRMHVVAVEPAESPVLAGKPAGAHKIEGIGIGFVPALWRREEVNELDAVSTDEPNAMARRLAREEAIFGGTSSGANVVTALRVAKRFGAGATVGTIIVDSGLRYLSTDLLKGAR